jgi:hypothetical protein
LVTFSETEDLAHIQNCRWSASTQSCTKNYP